jgi:branched-subunit amino acid aminotransferase/4-amino-4-deoxychorismate lyase
MHDLVTFNGELIASAKAFVSAVSSAGLYGKGIFTTIAVYDRKPFLWEKHWKRLESNAGILSIDVSEFVEATVKNSLGEIINENGVETGRARITFFDESPSAIWPFEPSRKTSLLITTADLRVPSQHFRLGISPNRINSTSPLAGIKSCNYLDKILALDKAKARAFDEAIQLNERGKIASACIANVFWLKDEKLYTPSLKTGCLPGTTREFILENLECEEVETGLETLKNADAIFLTSAGIGVVRAAEFDGIKMSQDPHAILKLLPNKN